MNAHVMGRKPGVPVGRRDYHKIQRNRLAFLVNIVIDNLEGNIRNQVRIHVGRLDRQNLGNGDVVVVRARQCK